MMKGRRAALLNLHKAYLAKIYWQETNDYCAKFQGGGNINEL